MFNRILLRCWAILMLGLLAACASQSLPTSPAPTAAEPTRAPAAPTAAVASAPTAAVSQPPTIAAADSAIPDSLTAEGYHVLGRPDAPLTLVMYSDFL